MHKGCALAWAGWVRETVQFPEAFLVYQVMHFPKPGLPTPNAIMLKG
jgi:hypothetical protein